MARKFFAFASSPQLYHASRVLRMGNTKLLLQAIRLRGQSAATSRLKMVFRKHFYCLRTYYYSYTIIRDEYIPLFLRDISRVSRLSRFVCAWAWKATVRNLQNAARSWWIATVLFRSAREILRTQQRNLERPVVRKETSGVARRSIAINHSPRLSRLCM